MKYVSGGGRGFDQRPYWQYLRSVDKQMPTHLFDFASNQENHNFTNPNSLHDSWLKISEVAMGEKHRKERQ
jgi:hypothetical protein